MKTDKGKILLLNPPGVRLHTRSSRWGGRKNRSGVLSLPIFLASASALLRQNGVPVKLLDAAALGQSLEDIGAFIRSENIRIVVMEVSTPSIDQDARTADYLKKNMGVKIVFVGAHGSALPEETLRKYPVDIVCMSEYEYSLLFLYRSLICQEMHLKNIEGIAFLENNKLVITSSRKLVDLDELPFPDYDLLPLRKYYDPIVRHRPCLPLRASRGCPYKCIFCVAPQVLYDHKIRYHSSENVVKDIKKLIDLGAKEIFIDDDTFTCNKRWVMDICRNIADNNIKIDWSCFARYDNINEEILNVLKKAQCYMLRFGIESASQEILNNCQKGLEIDRIKEASGLVKEYGLKTHVTVMFGLPGETKQTLRQTLSLVKELDPDYAQFTIATPYPGTEYYRQMKSEKRLMSDNWSDYDGSCRSIVRLDNISGLELEDFVDYAYKSFYFRPGYVIKRLAGIRCRDEVYYLIRSSWSLIKSRL